MVSIHQSGIGRAERVRLILNVRKAYQRFAELLQEYRTDSPRAQAAFVCTSRKLSAMNRALALVALDAVTTERPRPYQRTFATQNTEEWRCTCVVVCSFAFSG